MAFFHHNIIRKYTLALLSTFSNLEVQKVMSDGVTITSNMVPIRFSSREKSTIFSEVETSQLTNGNFNIIPRASLVFNSMTRAPERTTSKFNKINTTINVQTETELISYQYNAIPHDFSFSLIIQADGMNEATQIAEQIASHFNPTYLLKINEIPLQSEPSSIALMLDGLEFEQQEYDEFSSNMVTITCELTLKGNIYPPITDQGLLKNIRIYLDQYENEENEKVKRQIKLEFDTIPETGLPDATSFFKTDWVANNKVSANAPGDWYFLAQDGTPILNQSGISILSPGAVFISGETQLLPNSSGQYLLNFIDVDDETEFTYIWNILSGNATITQNNVNPVTINTGVTGVVLLQAQVIDNDGNVSPYTTKNIIVDVNN
jgi:hypothetical protein